MKEFRPSHLSTVNGQVTEGGEGSEGAKESDELSSLKSQVEELQGTLSHITALFQQQSNSNVQGGGSTGRGQVKDARHSDRAKSDQRNKKQRPNSFRNREWVPTGPDKEGCKSKQYTH